MSPQKNISAIKYFSTVSPCLVLDAYDVQFMPHFFKEFYLL